MAITTRIYNIYIYIFIYTYIFKEAKRRTTYSTRGVTLIVRFDQCVQSICFVPWPRPVAMKLRLALLGSLGPSQVQRFDNFNWDPKWHDTLW